MLLASLCIFFGLLALMRLPQPYHAVFESEAVPQRGQRRLLDERGASPREATARTPARSSRSSAAREVSTVQEDGGDEAGSLPPRPRPCSPAAAAAARARATSSSAWRRRTSSSPTPRTTSTPTGAGCAPRPRAPSPARRWWALRGISTGMVNGELRHPHPASRSPPELLARGRHRYEIVCSNCHGLVGNGDSMVADNMATRLPPSLVALGRTAGRLLLPGHHPGLRPDALVLPERFPPTSAGRWWPTCRRCS